MNLRVYFKKTSSNLKVVRAHQLRLVGSIEFLKRRKNMITKILLMLLLAVVIIISAAIISVAALVLLWLTTKRG